MKYVSYEAVDGQFAVIISDNGQPPFLEVFRGPYSHAEVVYSAFVKVGYHRVFVNDDATPLPTGYTDTIEITYCNDQPHPQGFAKIKAKAPLQATQGCDKNFCLGTDHRWPRCPKCGSEWNDKLGARAIPQSTSIDNFIVDQNGTTVKDYIANKHPDMRILSFKPVPTIELPEAA